MNKQIIAKRIFNLFLPLGLLIIIVHHIINHFIKISDAITDPIAVVSIILMLIGIAYTGWNFGKKISN